MFNLKETTELTGNLSKLYEAGLDNFVKVSDINMSAAQNCMNFQSSVASNYFNFVSANASKFSSVKSPKDAEDAVLEATKQAEKLAVDNVNEAMKIVKGYADKMNDVFTASVQAGNEVVKSTVLKTAATKAAK